MRVFEEVTIIFITSTIVWSQVRKQGGTQPCPSIENWVKDLLSMSPPIRKRPSFHPYRHSLPSGSFYKPLILIPQRADRTKSSHRKLIKLITGTTALSKSVKLWAMPCRVTQNRQVVVESSDKMWSTGEENGKPLQYSCLENPMSSMKGKKTWQWKMNSPVGAQYWSVGAQYATREEQRNNSRKNEETESKWKCPAVDVTDDGSKLQCYKEKHHIGTWNVRSMNQGKLEVVKQGDGKREHQYFSNLWTKMDQNGQT